MIIHHASAHRWTKPVSTDPLKDFGKNTLARLRSTLTKIDSLDIQNIIAPLHEDFLTWFLPLYETRINEKANPRLFDIRTKTLGSKKPEKYYSMALYEDGAPVGGTIFSLSKSRLSVAYRTYSNTWLNASLQANPSSYTEYLICQYAHQQGKTTIIHGKDRNPYGINSSIGLANFKLSANCHAELPKVFEVETIDTDNVTTDALILEYPTTGTTITQAYLVADTLGQKKWGQLTKHPELLNVTPILRCS